MYLASITRCAALLTRYHETSHVAAGFQSLHVQACDSPQVLAAPGRHWPLRRHGHSLNAAKRPVQVPCRFTCFVHLLCKQTTVGGCEEGGGGARGGGLGGGGGGQLGARFSPPGNGGVQYAMKLASLEPSVIPRAAWWCVDPLRASAQHEVNACLEVDSPQLCTNFTAYSVGKVLPYSRVCSTRPSLSDSLV